MMTPILLFYFILFYFYYRMTPILTPTIKLTKRISFNSYHFTSFSCYSALRDQSHHHHQAKEDSQHKLLSQMNQVNSEP